MGGREETTMSATILPDVTIRLNAGYDLVAAGLSAEEADAYAAVYRQAAEAICDGLAEVTVERVAGGEGDPIGCDPGWAKGHGLCQAAHDCCQLEGDQWTLNATAVERHRRSLRRWLMRAGLIDDLGVFHD